MLQALLQTLANLGFDSQAINESFNNIMTTIRSGDPGSHCDPRADTCADAGSAAEVSGDHQEPHQREQEGGRNGAVCFLRQCL